MTSDNTLLLIPGLFTAPAVNQRLEDEPPSKFTKEEMERHRFVALCRFVPIEKMTDVKVRWQPTAAWGPPSSAWVGRVTDCRVQ